MSVVGEPTGEYVQPEGTSPSDAVNAKDSGYGDAVSEEGVDDNPGPPQVDGTDPDATEPPVTGDVTEEDLAVADNSDGDDGDDD